MIAGIDPGPPIGTLLVASSGGHLAELVKLAPRFGVADRPTWVTFAGEQAEIVLEGEPKLLVPYTRPRDYRNVARNTYLAHRLFARRRVERVVSTGAGIALSFLPVARAHGVEAHYVESAARPLGPSLTGRVLSRVPGVRLHTQFPAWAGGRWRHSGSVYDGFEPGPVRGDAPDPLRVAVTVGTLFPFERLTSRLNDVLPDGAEVVLWQAGAGDGAYVEPRRLIAAYAQADAVVCHGGVGSILDVLDAGHLPIVVPRRARFGEHVDDHQVPLAADLAGRGLAIYREAEELTTDDLLLASRSSVRTLPRPPAFELDG